MSERVWLRDLGIRGVSADYEDGYNHGAAVAFGLMGMAEAIRERLSEEAWGRVEVESKPMPFPREFDWDFADEDERRL